VSVDSANGAASLHAIVTAVEYLGGEALITCRIGDKPILARVRGADVPAVGAAVGVSWQASAAHIYDAQSGHRVAINLHSAERPKLHSVSHAVSN
jgi:sn-glycerol 3-phosphate transport system ATP-binding protein